MAIQDTRNLNLYLRYSLNCHLKKEKKIKFCEKDFSFATLSSSCRIWLLEKRRMRLKKQKLSYKKFFFLIVNAGELRDRVNDSVLVPALLKKC